MKKKIIIIFSIFSVIMLSIISNILPFKVKASGYYPDTEYGVDTYLISKNDYGVISVNHAYNYIMGLGVSEQDQFELASIYQTNDDDNDYIKVIGYNALDNNNTAQVYIKVLCYNSSESANVQTLFTSQITTTSQWYLTYYRVDNEQMHTHNTYIYFTFGVGYVKNYNAYTILPSGANGRDNVLICNNCSILKDNSQIQAINYNDEYDIYVEIIERFFMINDLDDQNNGVMIHDYIINDVQQFYDNGYDNGYNYGYDRGYSLGYDRGDEDGYYRGEEHWKEVGALEKKAEYTQQGYDRGIAENLSSNWLTDTFSSIGDFLSIQVFPGFQIGYLLAIPIIFGILRMILHIWKN